MSREDEIREMVDRETRAWDTQDPELLVSIFHPDMVWPWPADADAHDPAGGGGGMGRFDAARWRASWAALFRDFALVHNRRETVFVSVAPDGGGAFAVVDVDTLWRPRGGGEDQVWLGRACKVYTRVGGEWRLIAHTGLLRY